VCVCVCVLIFVHQKSGQNQFLHSDRGCCLLCSIQLHVKEVYNLFCYLSATVTTVKDSFSGYSEIEIGEN